MKLLAAFLIAGLAFAQYQPPIGSSSVGTVTSVATTSPITGGTFTTSGTIGCATCVTSAASLTANRIVLGGGSQAVTVLGSLGTTTTVLHGNAAGAPTFGAVTASDVSGTTGSGNFVLATSPTLITPNIGAATATTVNGMTITSNSGTFAVGNAKSAVISNTLTFTGTDGSSVNFGAGGTVLYSVTGGTCTNQVVTAISTAGAPTCTTITSAYVNNSIALTGTDINTSNQVTVTHLSSALPVNQGGTGLTAGTSGGILSFTAEGTLASSAALASGQFVLGGGAGASPTTSFSVVPYANGGCNSSTAWTQGSVLFAGASACAQDNANLFWDATNHRLGVGTTSPSAALDVVGTYRTIGVGSSAYDPTSGQGIEISYRTDLGYGQILGYNRSGSAFLPMRFVGSTVSLQYGANIGLFINTNGNIGIGTTSPGSNTLSIINPTATTGATRVLISLGAADSSTTTTLTNAGVTASTGGFSSGFATFLMTTTAALTAGSTANVPTLTSGPVTGNPTKWIAINDNGTTRWVPAW